jgi:5-methylcytosine-specific restriction endonuclease McrA
VPYDTATIDHILSRAGAPSYEAYRARSNLVLACLGCNQRRNNIECATRAPGVLENSLIDFPVKAMISEGKII